MKGGESLPFMSFRLYLTASEYHTFIPIGFLRCLSSINVSGNLPLRRTSNRSALVQVMGGTFPRCWG